MLIRVGALVLIVCTAGAVACQTDDVFSPEDERDPIDTTYRDSSRLVRVSIWPDEATVIQGDSLMLVWSATDQWRTSLRDQVELAFTSGDSGVARVRAGLDDVRYVIGFGPGSTTVSATFRMGRTSRTARMQIGVADSTFPPSLELIDQYGRWDPNPANVAAGGLVTWYSYENRPGPIYVWDNGTLDSVVLDMYGSGSRRFNTPGVVNYCVRCLDPTDGGIIRVR